MNTHFSDIWSRLKWYIWVFLVFWVIGGIFFFSFGYKESFLVLNRLNTPVLDFLMPHYTHLGHGALVSVLFVLSVRRLDLDISISLILSLLVVWVFVWLGKHTWFEHWHRPVTVIWSKKIHFISLAQERFHTFPSGHSAVATTVFFFITAYAGKFNPLHGLGLGLIAVTACYSRLYIGVHFLGDLIAGSMIGVFSGLAVYYVVKSKMGNWLASLSASKKEKLKKGIYLFGAVALAIDLFFLYTQNYQ